MRVTTTAMIEKELYRLVVFIGISLLSFRQKRYRPHIDLRKYQLLSYSSHKKLDFVKIINIILVTRWSKYQQRCLLHLILFYAEFETLLIFTMDNTQIQPIGGRPLLTSCHMLLCFKIVALGNSIRASVDLAFQKIKEFARYNIELLKINQN